MIYRSIPAVDAAPLETLHGDRPRSSWRQRLKCAMGMHERVLDYVSQLAFCTACNCVVSLAYGEIFKASDERIRFEIEYVFIQARSRGEMTGDGQLRWLGWGVPESDKVAAVWAQEARIGHLRADIATLQLMLLDLPEGWSPEREEFTDRIETLRAELAEKKEGKP